jgi:hypothetical protein
MRSLLKLLAFVAISSVCLSQSQQYKVGLSVAIQNTQSDILIPIVFGDKYSISPAFGIASISNQATDYSIGAILKYYLTQSDGVSSFVGGRIGMLTLSPKVGDAITDYVYGPLLGGEYFIATKFSIGVEAQLNIVKSAASSNRFSNPGGTNIGTATALFATIWF